MRSTAIAVALVVAAPFLVPASRGESPPKGVSAGWWSAAQANIEASEYHVTWSIANGLADLAAAYQAPNRAHGFRTYFTEQGIRVIPRTESPPSWEWGLSLARWGRSGATEAAGDARLFVDGNRVEIDRGPIVEWFVNDAKGLEQGFTIGTPPEGAESGAPLVVDLALTGTLEPMLSEDGQAIDFAVPGGQRVIHYAQLAASDARGTALRAWMQGFCEEGLRGIRLVVDDRDAAYPVTIDPLATNPAWTDHRSGQFGYSVAPAGDVNGDGYGDVIVGAPLADTGAGEGTGAVFVYYGSPSGPSTEADWINFYASAGDHYGHSVATAGDVNGDGYSDVIIGAPDSGVHNTGAVFVYHGSPGGLGSFYDWSRGTTQSSCWLGSSVASAGTSTGTGTAT